MSAKNENSGDLNLIPFFPFLSLLLNIVTINNLYIAPYENRQRWELYLKIAAAVVGFNIARFTCCAVDTALC